MAIEKARRSRRRHALSERGLGIAGLMLAVASGVFASGMISGFAWRPGVNGVEYFGVFAKLTPTRGAPAPSANGDDADPMPVGSVRKGADAPDAEVPAASPVDPRTVPPPGADPLKGYRLRYVFQGRALLLTPTGLREVTPGTFLPGVGFVTAIEMRGGRWVVVTPRGIIGETQG
jgi:hypothetical protein